MYPQSTTRRFSLKERAQANLFRRRTTDATPAREASTVDANAAVLRRNTLAAIRESAKRLAVEPLERRIPKIYRLAVVNDVYSPPNRDPEEDAMSLVTFDSQSTAVNSSPKGKKANQLLMKLGRKVMAPLEITSTRSQFRELMVFFCNLGDNDRVNLGRYFNKSLLLKNIVKAGRAHYPADLRSLAHAVLDQFMQKRDAATQANRIPPIAMFASTADFIFFLLEDFEFCTTKYTWPHFVGMLNYGGQLKELIQFLAIAESENVNPLIDIEKVKDTLINLVKHTPNAEVLELLGDRNGRKLDTLRLTCVDTLCDRFAKDKIHLADVIQIIRKADCYAAFLTCCLKNIQWGVTVACKILDAIHFEEERPSFISIAHDTVLRAIKEQHGKFINWVDSLPTEDGMTLSSEAWATFLQLERIMPSTVFATELLIPFYNLHGKYKDGETQRQYFKVQDICFQLDRFRVWNACGALTWNALMHHVNLQASLKHSILQQFANKIGTSDNIELFEYIEKTCGWVHFTRILIELCKSEELGSPSQRGLGLEVLKSLWSKGPGSLCLAIYDGVYFEWILQRNQERFTIEMLMLSLLNWITANPPESLNFESYWATAQSEGDTTCQTYVKFLVHSKKLCVIKAVLRHSFEKDQAVLQLLKDAFALLRAEGSVGVIEYFIAAKESIHSDFTILGTLRNFVSPEMFVEELVENLSGPPPEMEGGAMSQARRHLIAEEILMSLLCLTRHISDYSFVLRLFGESSRLSERLHYRIFEDLNEKLSMEDIPWTMFFNEVKSCIGWEGFIQKLLDEVDDLRETRSQCIRTLAKEILIICFNNHPPEDSIDVLIREIQERRMVGYYQAWMSENLPHLVDRLEPHRQAHSAPSLPVYSEPSTPINSSGSNSGESSSSQNSPPPPSYQLDNQMNFEQAHLAGLMAQFMSMSNGALQSAISPGQFVAVPVSLITLLQHLLGFIVQSTTGAPEGITPDSLRQQTRSSQIPTYQGLQNDINAFPNPISPDFMNYPRVYPGSTNDRAQNSQTDPKNSSLSSPPPSPPPVDTEPRPAFLPIEKRREPQLPTISEQLSPNYPSEGDMSAQPLSGSLSLTTRELKNHDVNLEHEGSRTSMARTNFVSRSSMGRTTLFTRSSMARSTLVDDGEFVGSSGSQRPSISFDLNLHSQSSNTSPSPEVGLSSLTSPSDTRNSARTLTSGLPGTVGWLRRTATRLRTNHEPITREAIL